MAIQEEYLDGRVQRPGDQFADYCHSLIMGGLLRSWPREVEMDKKKRVQDKAYLDC